jgi:dTMP kinase
MTGIFISLEGGEGAGKSTIIKAIAAHMSKLEPDTEIVVTREPGGGSIGSAVRQIVLNEQYHNLDPRAEALLFAADRSQHVAEVIRPALDRGAFVVCDRYIDSSVAYQGHARGLGVEQIANLSAWGSGHTFPDLTIVIDIDPQIGISRKMAQQETNRMENLDIDFHHAVRQAFLDMAAQDEKRYVIVDGHQPIDYVIADVLGIVTARWLNRHLNPEDIG